MRNCELVVPTASASQYMQQLCKHFAHKVRVEYDTDKGFADFPFGKCHMSASADSLHIRCVTPHADAEETMQRVIGDHLARFMWREKPQLVWQEGYN